MFSFLIYRFYLKDLDSSNGTFINNEQVKSDVKVEIFTNDKVQFGQDVYDGLARHLCLTAKYNESCQPERNTVKILNPCQVSTLSAKWLSS